MAAIELENVDKSYRWNTKIQPAAQNITLSVRQGEFVFLIGNSGAGKSTLLQLMTGGIKPERGTVRLYGQDYEKMSEKRRKAAALMFGYVWQEPQLMKRRTVFENVYRTALVGECKCRSATARERVQKALGVTGMIPYAAMRAEELSLGQCRRMELSRALVNNPSILILDEITANLDPDNVWDIAFVLDEIHRHGTTIIMATHSRSMVNIMRRRVITLSGGAVTSDVRRGRYGDI
ncbi:MAG: ATP-binding cassette domain-containing protein [Oscillospiraceae bacterium]|nr:ATP-binding cassette domain-containing protein [Oscillospiraceae bacterium]